MVIHDLTTDDTSLCIYEEVLSCCSASLYLFGMSRIDDHPTSSTLLAARVLVDDGHVARVTRRCVLASERGRFSGATLLGGAGLAATPSERLVRSVARKPQDLVAELLACQGAGYECEAELRDAIVLAAAQATAQRLKASLDLAAPVRAVLARWLRTRRVQARADLQKAFRDACVAEDPERLAELALETWLRRHGLCAKDCKGWLQCRSF